jgi:HlyD family secretion protein
MRKSDFYEPKNIYPEDTIGKQPSWILKTGISIIAMVFLLFFIFSIFIHFPEKISSDIIITTDKPPIRVNSLSNGLITKLYVKDNGTVKQGQELYYINDNSTNKLDLDTLKSILQEPIDFSFQRREFKLGNIQSAYEEFVSVAIKYKEYLQYDPDQLEYYKNIALIKEYKNLIAVNKRKTSLNSRKLDYEKSKLQRLIYLNKEGVVSKQEADMGNIVYLEQLENHEDLFNNLSNINLKITELEKSNIILANKKTSLKTSYEKELENKRMNLLNSITEWDNAHIIKAPISGKVTYIKHDILDTSTLINDKLLAIIPDQKNNEVIGKMFSPIYNSGKIKIGKKVNIFLDNYPYQDFGIIEGSVKNISLIPEKNTYLIKVKLTNKSFQTNNNKKINFSTELSGKAEIIIEDKSLFKRFFEKLFYSKKI